MLRMTMALGLVAVVNGLTHLPARAEPPPIDRAPPDKFETATFALGCFWCPDGQFGVMPGVIRTRVGYCGGKTARPTYENIGDHAEALQIDFDPAKITYEELLHAFFELHNPCADALSSQYRSAIFYHDGKQQAAAQQALAAEQKRRGEKAQTEIAPLRTFTLAEDYHQKYHLQENKVFKAHFRELYPQTSDFVNSTAAARVNGFVDKQGKNADFERDIDSLGLPPEARKQLEEIAGGLK
jgi:methionine-S-sulfoxide reductase